MNTRTQTKKPAEAPEHWMCRPAHGGSGLDLLELPESRETIRQWYERTTKKVRRAIKGACIVAAIAGVLLWLLAGFGTLARIQTFQGAFTIPVVGGIWLLSFIFMFLIPSREASFRSQEWIEAMVAVVERTVRSKVAPAAETWLKLGERLERDIPALIHEFREGLQTLRYATTRIELALEKNELVAEEARPVIDSVRRLGERLENEIADGLLEDIRGAVRGARIFAPPKPGDPNGPDYGKALEALSKYPMPNGGRRG